MYLKLKAITAQPAEGLQGNTRISVTIEQLLMEKSKARMNGFAPNGSKVEFVKYFSEVYCVD